MSIIHGIIHLNDTGVKSDDIRSMEQTGRPLGPDGSCIWPDYAGMSTCGPGKRSDASSAFAFNMLRTLPASRYESMPLHDKDAGLVIVADARIDNRDELIDALDIPGYLRNEISDVRIILSAYKKWREECAVHLLGDFAFAIWNERRKKLFLARDIFGLRPLYYHLSNRSFVFSSSIQCLLAIKSMPTSLDEEHLAYNLCRLSCDDNSTLYKEIKRFLPAHTMVFENEKLEVKRYWTPDRSREIRYSDDEDYVEEYRQILTEAVRCRLASSSGVGSLLSGGLDSPSICAIAARLLKERGEVLNTYSFLLSEKEKLSKDKLSKKDERPFIELMHNIAGISGHFVTSDIFPESVPESVKNTLYSLTRKPGYLSTTFSMAQAENIRVILAGFGGDQCATYAGREPVFESLISFNPSLFFRHIKAIAEYNKRPFIRTLANVLRQFINNRNRPISETDFRDFIYNRPVIGKELAEEIGIYKRARSHLRFNRRNATSCKEKMVYLLYGKDLGEDQELSDSYHCERRYPLFDRRLIEFCLSVPPEQHFLGMNRRLIRRAMKGILPDELRLRHDKTYSNAPGIFNIIYEDIEYYRNILTKARTNPNIARYIDLDKLHNRLEHTLAEVMREGDISKFMMGPTMCGFAMAELLDNYFSQKNRK